MPAFQPGGSQKSWKVKVKHFRPGGSQKSWKFQRFKPGGSPKSRILAFSAWWHSKQGKKMPTYLYTDSTSLAHRNYLRNNVGAPLGLTATGPVWEGGTCIFKISWPKLTHHKFGKDVEYACGTHTLQNQILCEINVYGLKFNGRQIA